MPNQSGRQYGTRTKARKRAVDILFEADLRERSVAETLAERTLDADPPVREYTSTLVEGVIAQLDDIDARISSHLAPGWRLERMPRVDRALARMATWEIIYGGIDAAVAITEAVFLATELSTDDSGNFLQGVLSALVEKK